MRTSIASTLIAGLLASCTLCAYAETRGERVDRLFRFFNIQETNDYGAKSLAMRVRTAAKQASDEAVASLAAAKHGEDSQKLLDAVASLNRALDTFESAATANAWRYILIEQLSDEDLDAAVAYFLSPSGSRFMASKGVADSVLARAVEQRFAELVRPAAESLQAVLSAVAKR